eukprot:COSAG02_NODE_1293_length_13410_cov_13.392004_3_plen_70_part_00
MQDETNLRGGACPLTEALYRLHCCRSILVAHQAEVLLAGKVNVDSCHPLRIHQDNWWCMRGRLLNHNRW